MFYVPACPEFNKQKEVIESHGGIVVEGHDCSTYQIKPEGS